MDPHHPYVISQDVFMLMEHLGHPMNPAQISALQDALGNTLRSVFHSLDYVQLNELDEGIAHLTEQAPFQLIWQTDLFNRGDLHVKHLSLDVNRMVTPYGDDLGTQMNRPGTPSLRDQVHTIPPGDYGIVDDVVFSGKGMAEMITLLGTHDINIKAVYAGIAVSEGEQRLRRLNVIVHAVRRYKDVVDEVCERDFVPFVPLSGRTVHMANGENRCLPYLYPWGRPCDWASIPEINAERISRECISIAQQLWKEVAPEVKISDLQRIPYGLQPTEKTVHEFLAAIP